MDSNRKRSRTSKQLVSLPISDSNRTPAQCSYEEAAPATIHVVPVDVPTVNSSASDVATHTVNQPSNTQSNDIFDTRDPNTGTSESFHLQSSQRKQTRRGRP